MDIFSRERWRLIAEVARSAGASDWQTAKWKVRGAIPGAWHLRLLAAARAAGVALTEEDLLSTTNRNREVA